MGLQKKEIVFGLHAVQALLSAAPQRVLELQVLKGRHDQRLKAVLDMAERNNIGCCQVTRQQLDELVEGNLQGKDSHQGKDSDQGDSQGNHQGIVAFCKPAQTYDEVYLFHLLKQLDVAPFLLVLDGVTDPHNLGACLRSAEAAGVHAVIAPKDNSAGLTPVARKVACGAAEVLPFIPVTNLARTLKKLQDQGVWMTGAAGEAEQSVYQANLTGPLALVMGAEGKGLRRLTREHCDHLINIPMAGSVSSLNVSVATGVCLFEAIRQRMG